MLCFIHVLNSFPISELDNIGKIVKLTVTHGEDTNEQFDLEIPQNHKGNETDEVIKATKELEEKGKAAKTKAQVAAFINNDEAASEKEKQAINTIAEGAKKAADNAKVASLVATVNLINKQSYIKPSPSVSVLKYDTSLEKDDPVFDALTDIDFEEKNITAVDVSVPDLIAWKVSVFSKRERNTKTGNQTQEPFEYKTVAENVRMDVIHDAVDNAQWAANLAQESANNARDVANDMVADTKAQNNAFKSTEDYEEGETDSALEAATIAQIASDKAAELAEKAAAETNIMTVVEDARLAQKSADRAQSSNIAALNAAEVAANRNALRAEEHFASTQKQNTGTSSSEHTDTIISLDLKTKATKNAVEASKRVNIELARQSENQARQAAVNANAAAFAAKVAAQKKGLTEEEGKKASLAVAESKAAANEAQSAARKAEADATRTKDDARPDYAAQDAKKAKLNAEKAKNAALKAIRAAMGSKNKVATNRHYSTEPPISQVTILSDNNTSQHAYKTNNQVLKPFTLNNPNQISVEPTKSTEPTWELMARVMRSMAGFFDHMAASANVTVSGATEFFTENGSQDVMF